MSILYIVSTPIGNLEDVTQRALGVLRSVARVLAEDTRRTAILLQRFEISTPLVSLHEHNEASRAARVIEWLSAGESLALVSDAGTPLLSDPGERLVNDVLAAGHTVVPVPGASALLAALVGAGLPAAPFTFYGFPPRGGRERRTLLQQVATSEHTSVVYESPNRLVKLLEELAEHCGAERPVVVARELTKVHEEFQRGSVAEVLAHYAAQPAIRGEVVVLVGGGEAPVATAEDGQSLAASLLEAGLSPSDAAREVARRLQLGRNEAYRIVQSLREATSTE